MEKSSSKVEEHGEYQEEIIKPKIAVHEHDEKFEEESRRTEAT